MGKKLKSCIKDTWPSDTLSVYREALGWAIVSVLLASMMLMRSWEYLWGFAGDVISVTGRVMHYQKSYGRSYGLGCSGGMTICQESDLIGVLVLLALLGGSGYLFTECCRVVAVSYFSACIWQ